MTLNIIEGGLPLSVSTSYAVETIIGSAKQSPLDPSRIVPNPIRELGYYNTLMVDVRTLLRNVLGSLDKLSSAPTPRSLTTVMLEEMDIIRELVPLNVIFFQNDFSRIERLFPTLLRTPNTAKQKTLSSLSDGTISSLGLETSILTIKTSNLQVDSRTVAYMLSHNPYNLTLVDKITDLTLIESHTGVTKARQDWYTKYYKLSGISLERLPLQRELLAILGDSYMFRPAAISIRKELAAIAEDKRWTSFTAKPRIRADILRGSEPLRTLYKAVEHKLD